MQLFDDETADPGCPAHPIHEEYLNTATHGIGILLSLTGAAAIVTATRFGDTSHAIAWGVYVISLVVVYTISTLSHAVQRARPKHLLGIWDQGLIYLLIAGTYTPLICAFVPLQISGPVLIVIWGAALIGFYSKVVAQHRVHHSFSAVSYVVLGWVPALVLVKCFPPACLMWMAIGGLSYTVGTLFLAMDRRFSYYHAMWHVFVMIGSASHFYAIFTFVVLDNETA